MAITAAALQTALGDGQPTGPTVVLGYGVAGTLQKWIIDGGGANRGRRRVVSTTASDNAATQAAAVLVVLAASKV
jgi:hypothetical protein